MNNDEFERKVNQIVLSIHCPECNKGFGFVTDEHEEKQAKGEIPPMNKCCIIFKRELDKNLNRLWEHPEYLSDFQLWAAQYPLLRS